MNVCSLLYPTELRVKGRAVCTYKHIYTYTQCTYTGVLTGSPPSGTTPLTLSTTDGKLKVWVRISTLFFFPLRWVTLVRPFNYTCVTVIYEPATANCSIMVLQRLWTKRVRTWLWGCWMGSLQGWWEVGGPGESHTVTGH